MFDHQGEEILPTSWKMTSLPPSSKAFLLN